MSEVYVDDVVILKNYEYFFYSVVFIKKKGYFVCLMFLVNRKIFKFWNKFMCDVNGLFEIFIFDVYVK